MKKFPENEELFKSQSFGLDANAVSHTEYTGLIPFKSYNEEALENYDHIENYSPATVSKDT